MAIVDVFLVFRILLALTPSAEARAKRTCRAA
jgi:hypothetical protein